MESYQAVQMVENLHVTQIATTLRSLNLDCGWIQTSFQPTVFWNYSSPDLSRSAMKFHKRVKYVSQSIPRPLHASSTSGPASCTYFDMFMKEPSKRTDSYRSLIPSIIGDPDNSRVSKIRANGHARCCLQYSDVCFTLIASRSLFWRNEYHSRTALLASETSKRRPRIEIAVLELLLVFLLPKLIPFSIIGASSDSDTSSDPSSELCLCCAGSRAACGDIVNGSYLDFKNKTV